MKTALSCNNGVFVILVLSRRNCESVVVGDPAGRAEQMLKVTVLEIGRDRVRLGFEGASDVPVHRWEVWQRIRSNVRPGDRPQGTAPGVAQ
jgi:carbon storage regulator CsrA